MTIFEWLLDEIKCQGVLQVHPEVGVSSVCLCGRAVVFLCIVTLFPWFVASSTSRSVSVVLVHHAETNFHVESVVVVKLWVPVPKWINVARWT